MSGADSSCRITSDTQKADSPSNAKYYAVI